MNPCLLGDWRNHRVLITGAAGFLGRRMRLLLIEAGAVVVGLDRVAGSDPWSLADVTEWDQMRRALIAHEPDTVMHLAGHSHILAAAQTPYLAWEVNAGGTYATLDACRWYQDRTHGLRAIVVASSNHVYGNLRDRHRSIEQPWTEDDALMPTDTYGASKAAADLAARCYAHAYGLPVIPLRHVNAFGPSDPHDSHIVTGTIRSALRGEPIRLRGNGAAVKGYLFEDDVIGAYARAAELLWDSFASGQPLNAGPESPTTVLDLVQMIIDIVGKPSEIVFSHEDASQDAYVEHLDASRFRAMGWRDELTLRQGLERTVASMRGRS